LVETAENLGDNRFQENEGEAAERETVGKRAEPLLDGAYGSFDFSDVSIGSNNVEMNRGKVGSNGGKFMVTVNIGDGKTADGIKIDDTAEFFGDGRSGAVGDRDGGAETYVTRDGVKETLFLDEEKIDAQGNVGV
jgi:hypothetical protein